MQIKFFLLCSLFFCCFLSASAQVTAENQHKDLPTEKQDWILHEDMQQKIIWIDFGSIQTGINDIRVKTRNSEIAFADIVADLPSDTIYELDLNNLPQGEYVIEVRTYKEVLEKKVTI